MTVESAVQVNLTCLAKTLADCFKFRNKIGLDVAIEAVKEAWNATRIEMDELLFDLWFDVALQPTRDIDLLGFGLAELPAYAIILPAQ